MKRYSKIALIALTACTMLATAAITAPAATLYNGWSYAIDAPDDGSGGGTYEYRGLAFRVQGNTAYFGISSGMPQTGNVVSGARNDSINYGDLFLNFSTHNLDTTGEFNDPKVFGIRFDPLNDSLGNITGSPNSTLGVFKNLTVASFTTQNSGWTDLQSYLNGGFGRTVNAMGDLQSSNTDVVGYLGNGVMYPNIASATKIGDITLMTRSQLATNGLDFNHFGADPSGNTVFGFSLDASLLPAGAFTAHNLQECINDGVALQGSNVPEPPPFAMVIAGGVGLGLLGSRRRRKV